MVNVKNLFKGLRRIRKAVGELPDLLKGLARLPLRGGEKLRILYYLAQYYLKHGRHEREFWERVGQVAKQHPGFPLGGWPPSYFPGLIYALIRTKRPSLVVETGVAAGRSSGAILLGLHHNGWGRLISIDLPRRGDASAALADLSQPHIPQGLEVGWSVPESLRYRWDLRLGDAKELLPPLLAELGGIDCFLHDSLHTEEHVRFELETAYPYLRPGGLLMADDVREVPDAPGTLAFQRFCEEKGLRFGLFLGRFAVAQKPFSPQGKEAERQPPTTKTADLPGGGGA
nr:class I SAM-dependent methyltransferase [Thermus thalpophilus]